MKDLIDFLVSGRINRGSEEPRFEDTAFTDYYHAHVQPLIAEFEQQRIAALLELRKRALRSCILAPIFIVVAITMRILLSAYPQAHVWIPGIAWAALLWLALYSWRPVWNYEQTIKPIIYPAVLGFFGPQFAYQAYSPKPVSDWQEFGIIPSYDSERAEDYIKGSYGGIAIELTKACLTKEVGSGKNRHTEIVFQGTLILLSTKKNFLGKTLFQHNEGAITSWLREKFGSLQRVHLVDPVFEKKFDVYSSDQVEARYIFTPTFMENVIALQDAANGADVQGSFYNHQLLLAVSSSSIQFQLGSVYEPVTFKTETEEIINQIKQIFAIIDVLSLDKP